MVFFFFLLLINRSILFPVIQSYSSPIGAFSFLFSSITPHQPEHSLSCFPVLPPHQPEHYLTCFTVLLLINRNILFHVFQYYSSTTGAFYFLSSSINPHQPEHSLSCFQYYSSSSRAPPFLLRWSPPFGPTLHSIAHGIIPCLKCDTLIQWTQQNFLQPVGIKHNLFCVAVAYQL